jgi:hypothetical protein
VARRRRLKVTQPGSGDNRQRYYEGVDLNEEGRKVLKRLEDESK